MFELTYPWVALRTVFSKKFRRTVEHGVDLDLAETAPGIFVTSWPAIGIEATFRNSRSSFRHWITESFKSSHVHIVNLCHPSERSYTPSEFPTATVFNCPVSDHAPPALAEFTIFAHYVAGIYRRLNSDHLRGNRPGYPPGVFIVHCKAGKGRSGTFTSALLAILHDLLSATSLADTLPQAPLPPLPANASADVLAARALATYAARRSLCCVGVTIPSQANAVARVLTVPPSSVLGDQRPPTVRLVSVYFVVPPAVADVLPGGWDAAATAWRRVAESMRLPGSAVPAYVPIISSYGAVSVDAIGAAVGATQVATLGLRASKTAYALVKVVGSPVGCRVFKVDIGANVSGDLVVTSHAAYNGDVPSHPSQMIPSAPVATVVDDDDVERPQGTHQSPKALASGDTPTPSTVVVSQQAFNDAVHRAAATTFGKKDCKGTKGDVRVAFHTVDLAAAASGKRPPLHGAFGANRSAAAEWLCGCVDATEGDLVNAAVANGSGGVYVLSPGLVDAWVGNTWRPGVVAAAAVVQNV